jgi:hypothetical protein
LKKHKYVILEKSEVRPFSRVRRGRYERVKGYLLPEKYKISYTPDTNGVRKFIEDHMSREEYGGIVTNAAKTSSYVMEGVNTAFLDVTNKARGTLEKMAKTNMSDLKQFLGLVFNEISEDVISIRKDLRKGMKK